MKNIWGLIFIIIVSLAIWVLSPFIFSSFSYFYSISDYSQRGTFGDSFGAVTSLFSLLSFIAVLYVLRQTQYREGEKERPFVITMVNPEESLTSAKITVRNQEDYSVLIKLKAKNYSNYLAHSLRIQCWVECRGENYGVVSESVKYPITSADISIPDILMDFNIKNDKTILDALSSDEEVFFKVNLNYRNTSNHDFKSLNIYLLSINDGDHNAINSLRRNDIDDKYFGGGKFVQCVLKESKDFIQ